MTDYNKIIASLSPEKRKLLELRLKKKGSDYNSFPLSFSQQRLWFLDQLEPGNPIYNIPSAVRLSGQLNFDILKKSINEVVRRHEILRVSFTNVNGQPMQVVKPELNLPLPIIDLQDTPSEKVWEKVAELAIKEAREPFQLTSGPLLRIKLLQLNNEEFVVLFTMHHIISDGWSMGILIREIGLLYNAFSQGKLSPLPDLTLQFGDFARWQQKWLQGTRLQKQLKYWTEQLGGAPEVLDLPTDRPRPPIQSYAGAHHSFIVPGNISRKLTRLSRQMGVTQFMTLLGALQTLLFRYSGQDDISIGSPIANRTRAETENLIGFFVNTLVFRTDLSGDPTFSELMARVKKMTLQAYAHQDVPFEKLVEKLQPERAMSHSPLFQVMFVLQNTPAQEMKLPGLTLSQLQFDPGTAEFDITLSMTETPEGLHAFLQYNTDLFSAETMKRFVQHFQQLLIAICEQPETPISRLVLSDTEEIKTIKRWNATTRNLPDQACVHQLFEQQVKESPETVAVIAGENTLSYRELNHRANQLARYLRKNNVGTGDLVGISVERSPEMIVGLLGILKAGAAYLPLDPNYPSERLEFMLQDSRTRTLVTQQALQIKLPQENLNVICLDSDWEKIALETDENPMIPVDSLNLAYLIYTSGSTGIPKGVQIPHQAVVNHNLAYARKIDLDATDRVLQFASVNFDAAVEEIFPTLIKGATLVLREPGRVLTGGAELLELIEKQKLTVLDLPTAFWHTWVQELAILKLSIPESLRMVIVGGDKALPERYAAWQKMVPVRWLNTYGPTETTIIATAFEAEETLPDKTEIPIGRPIDNTQTYILDENLQQTPVGVPGELCIGGIGVAQGYLLRPELTAEKFIPDPFSETPGARLYRTGDRARFMPDGNIQFLGRIDHQVKIRGFRVEPGEIESVLARYSGIKDVYIRVQGTEEKRLVAYCVPENSAFEVTEVRKYLSQQLPEYMIPAAFVALEEIPLTQNGKVDFRALPEAEMENMETSAEYVAPRTPVEGLIAEIWLELLSLSKVGIYDNFFEIGGHSLLATQLGSRLRDAFKIEIPLRTIFEAPTIAGIARTIEDLQLSAEGLQAPPFTRVPREGDLPVSFAQQRLWFLDQLEPNNPTYNIPDVIRINGALNIAILQRCFDEIIRRHESLRTTFKTVEGKAIQVIAPALKLEIPVIDLQEIPESSRETEALERIQKSAKQPFDLSQGPLVRATVYQLAPEEFLVLLNMHHIISDGWSTGVLIKEVATLYQAFSQNMPSPLPELPFQYADFAHWQRNWLQGEVLEKQLGYWKKQLSGIPSRLELPTDFPRPAVQTASGAHENFTISAELTQSINQLSQQTGVTQFMILLAAFQTLLQRYSGQNDICVGTPIANRNRSETENLIGFFVNTIVLRADFSQKITFRQFLTQVKETTLNAFAHQDLPFEKIVDAIQPDRDMSHSPLFQVMFILQNAPQKALKAEGLAFSSIQLDTGISNYDLTLAMGENQNRLGGAIEYNTDLFLKSTIQRFLQHFQRLLEAVVKNPDAALDAYSILPEAEKLEIVEKWNQTTQDFPLERGIHQLFEAQVSRTPDAPAVISEFGDLTYAELNTRANQLARHLVNLGVKPDTLVGISIERSLDLIVGLLGILKAGGAYLPLDPKYPAERLDYMIRDANIKILVTQDELVSALPAYAENVVRIDTDWPQILVLNSENLSVPFAPQNLAYVIYTSGSTGNPKGVQVTHHSVVNHNLAVQQEFGLTPADRILQFASINFDGAVEEIFPALLSGAAIVLRDASNGLTTGADLLKLIRQRELTILDLPTAYWHEWVYEMSLLEESIPEPLRLVIVGGDKASAERFESWEKLVNGKVRWLNTYGPTEGTVIATAYDPEKETEQNQSGIELPIGRPIANTQVYILDSNLQVVPAGVPGELFIGGIGVARGYVNRPDLTAEKFIPDPFSQIPGARLYRTGDLARFQSDGNIQFVGRVDHQVKIRGFRVELGEIESVLEKHLSLREVVVIAREDTPGNKQIVAYCIPSERVLEKRKPAQAPLKISSTSEINKSGMTSLGKSDFNNSGDLFPPESGGFEWDGEADELKDGDSQSPSETKKNKLSWNGSNGNGKNGDVQKNLQEIAAKLNEKSDTSETFEKRIQAIGEHLVSNLREYARERLPDYMVPAAFVMLENLPRTPNGKIDRRSLPKPTDLQDTASKSFQAPRTEVETKLAEIWGQVLGLKQVDVNKNFFELGGDSILTIQVVARASQAGLRITPRQLFEYPTIAGLAAVVGVGQAIKAEQDELSGEAPLTPIQQWFFEQDLPERHHWNQAVMFELHEQVDTDKMANAVQALMRQHDVLRMRYQQSEGGWRQSYQTLAEVEIPFSVVDFSEIDDVNLSAEIEREAAELQAGLDLTHGPIFRVACFNTGANRPARLLMIVHHLVVDGVSWRILLEDFQRAYQQLLQTGNAHLPPKTTAYKYWAHKLVEHAGSEEMQTELNYWQALATKPIPQLPVDFKSGENTEASAEVVSIGLTSDETELLLKEVPKVYRTQINDVLLTALVQGFTRVLNSRTLLVEMEGHGREDLFEDVDLSRTVGWFTSIYPAVLDLRNINNTSEALKSVKEQLRQIPNHGIGYSILRYLSSDPAVTEKILQLPDAEISFNYLGQFGQTSSETSAFKPAQESAGADHSPRAPRQYLLEINGSIAGGKLQLDWTYSANLHRRITVERWAGEFQEALRGIITLCKSPAAGGFTPSDFPLANLNQKQLNKVLNKVGKSKGKRKI